MCFYKKYENCPVEWDSELNTCMFVVYHVTSPPPHHPPPPPSPPSPGAMRIFDCAICCIFIWMRFRLIRAPGITHELRSYPAVLSSSYLPYHASRTRTALSHRPSVQWVNTWPWPCTAYLRIRNPKKPMCHYVNVRYYCCKVGWRINKDYSILFYSTLYF